MTCLEMNNILDYWKDKLFLCNWAIDWKVSLSITQAADVDDCNDILPFVEITGDKQATIDMQGELRTVDELQVFDFDYVIVNALLQIIVGSFRADDPDEYDIKYDIVWDTAARLVKEKRRVDNENSNN